MLSPNGSSGSGSDDRGISREKDDSLYEFALERKSGRPAPACLVPHPGCSPKPNRITGPRAPDGAIAPASSPSCR